MAVLLRKIERFSADTIQLAIDSVFTENDAKRKFEEQLTRIAGFLEKPAKKRKIERRRVVPSGSQSVASQYTPSNSECAPSGSKSTPSGSKSSPSDSQNIFQEKIIPQIRKNIADYENRSGELVWNLDLNFLDEFNELQLTDLSTIKAIHAQIVEREKTATNLLLVIAFHRGMCYLHAREYIPADVTVKDWYTREFCISYITIHRYCLFATLIQSFPGLIYCGLTFSQITNHHNRIKDLINTDADLGKKLKSPTTISAQTKEFKIIPVKIQNVLTNKLPLDVTPDCIYENDGSYFKDGIDKTVLADKNITRFLNCLSEVEEEKRNVVMMEEDVTNLNIT